MAERAGAWSGAPNPSCARRQRERGGGDSLERGAGRGSFLPRGAAAPPLAGMMPSQPAPGSTSGTSRTPAPFEPAPGSTGGSFRTPTALSAHAAHRVTRGRTVLVDWCLERVEGEEGKIRVAGTTYTSQMSPQMRKGASSTKRNRNVAARVFRSSAIAKRLDYTTIESEDGYCIWIACRLNIPKTRENGFSQEVCECFEFGFPIKWQSIVNPKMAPDNKHARSPSGTTTASAPSRSLKFKYFVAMFLSDSFSSSIRSDFTENDYYSSVGYSGNKDGLTTQSLSNFLDDTVGKITASWGLCGLRMGVPKKPLAPPGKACNNSQESDQHESTQSNASKQELVNRSVSSVSVKRSTGSISPNSKADENILAPSKIMSVVNESYRSTVGCSQAEEDADIQQVNMHSCSSEHGMVTLPIDCTSSQLGEPGIPKSGKDPVNLGTTDALEPPTEGMAPKFGAIGGSKDSTGRQLRSGKVLGLPSGGTVGCGRAEEDADIQHENMRSCSSEHGIVTLPIDCTSSQLGEPGIAKSGKDSVNLGTTDALELRTEGMTPKFGAIGGSKDSTGRRLRSGKVLGLPSGGTLGCGRAEEDADIQHENMHSCSSEHGMVTLPIGCTSSQLGEPGIPKSGKDSVNLGTVDAFELPTEGMTPKFGAIGGSEASTGKRLRSGKVLGLPSGGPMKRVRKQNKIQQDASSKQMVNQGATSTADLTSHENDFSAAEVVVEEKLEPHDSPRRGRGRPPKGKGKGKGKGKRKRESACLFWYRV